MEQNLWRARRKWGRLINILGREGADKMTAGRFYAAVVKAVIMFGFETWVLTPQLEKALEGFQHWAERRMACIVPKLQPNITWV